MRQFIILIAALILSACAMGPKVPSVNVTHIELHGDTEFTLSERVSIQRAANEWRVQTHGLADIHVVFDGLSSPNGVPLVRADSDSDAVEQMDERTGCGMPSGGCVLGFVNTLGGVHNPAPEGGRLVMVLIDRASAKGADFYTRVVMHEFGHLLGMTHLEDPYALMAPATDGTHTELALTRPDLKEYCRVNACE